MTTSENLFSFENQFMFRGEAPSSWGSTSGRLKPPHALILPPAGATPYPHFRKLYHEFSEVAL
jgi:hypothetical protein